MRIFEFITQAFIDFFGIAQPDKSTKQRATAYICGLLALVLLIFLSFFIVVGHGVRY